jgi:hypothetical protein
MYSAVQCNQYNRSNLGMTAEVECSTDFSVSEWDKVANNL